ncbi:MAG: cytochrome P450 [Acidimicrobiales bacterium]|jgi:cytochrome P450
MQPDLSAAYDADTISDVEGFWSRPRAIREGVFHQLRQLDGMYFSNERGLELDGEVLIPPGPGYYSVVRHAEIVEASRKPELFCSGDGYNIVDLPPEFNEFFGNMISMDDPKHARMRGIVSRAFTPRVIQQIEELIAAKAAQIVDAVAPKGSCDFVTEIASRLPLAMICDLMGIAEDKYETVFEQSNIILSNGDPEYIPEGANPVEALLLAGANLAEIMKDLAAERQLNPADDLTTALLNAELDGEKLTDEEIGSFFILLCVAGNETTRNSISHGMKLITDNPEQRALLLSDLEAHMPNTVEEIVRMASPVMHFRRTVTTDGTVLGNQELNAGDKVVLWYGSGNRDELVFENPHDFDISRDNSGQIGFGGPGPHFCLGAHLARRQINLLFSELLTKLPDIAVVGEPDYLRSNFINGIKHLNVEFTPVD